MPTSQNPWFIKRSAITPWILKNLNKKLLERYWYNYLLKKGHGTSRDNRQYSWFVLGRSQVCISSQPFVWPSFPKTFGLPCTKRKKNTRKLVTLNKWTLWHTPYEECHTSKLSIVPILLDIPDDDEVLPKHVEYLQAVLNNYGYV